MIVSTQENVHLTYCLNVHPGETWAENLAAIREHALAVRQRVAPDKWFGLGLRLSHRATVDLDAANARIEAIEFFQEHKVYPFTVNGFPYGNFHHGEVKEQVYAPDWRSDERRDYTLALANILADVLPPEVSGSISTAPCSFKPWIRSRRDVQLMVERLMDCVLHLALIEEGSGMEIHLGLEPEPSCYLETTDETVAFFNEQLFRGGVAYLCGLRDYSTAEAEALIRRHLGVCFDTCHVALQFEEVTESLRRYRAEGIRISKIQLSAALQARAGATSCDALQAFSEGVYLHQVKARTASGEILSWTDLPEAMADLRTAAGTDEWRVHFHVPLFVDSFGALGSTASALTEDFFTELAKHPVSHLEIETYTFDVLPEPLRAGGVVNSIVQEYEWVLARLRPPL